MKVAYLGDENSHSRAAAEKMFSDALFEGLETIEEVAAAVTGRDCDICVLPAENSVEGNVNATFDALLQRELFIRAEYNAAIRHSLIGLSGATLDDIDTVYSHPQALSQCRNWLGAHLPSAGRVAVNSTSHALKLIKQKNQAAVALRPAEGMNVLAGGIEDAPNNTTRFVALSTRAQMRGNKASAVFGAENKPGGLLRVLEVFAAGGANMTAITSRPSRYALGDYIFFVDFTFTFDDAGLKELLAKLSDRAAFVKFLGRYEVFKTEA